MSKKALLIDYEWCSNCHTCEVECKMEHDIPEGKWGIKVFEIGPWQIEGDKWQLTYVPVPTDMCDLCADRLAEGKTAPCVLHCLGACMEIVKVDEIGQALAGKSNKVAVYLP